MERERELARVPKALVTGGGPLAGFLHALGDDGRSLREISRVAQLREGQVLKTGSRLGFVLEGKLAIARSLPDRTDAILGLMGPGDMFGHPFQNHGEGQIIVLSPGRAYEVDRRGFERLISQRPMAEWALLRSLFDEVEAAREWVLLMGSHKVVERVAAYFLLLCRQQMARNPRAAMPLRIRIEIRRADLARYLCARVESLSRAFHHLELLSALRIIEANEFEILDLDRLTAVANHDILNHAEPRSAQGWMPPDTGFRTLGPD